jgi:hypothetical protein
MRGPEGGRPCKRFVKTSVSDCLAPEACPESRWEDELKSALFDTLMGLRTHYREH